MFYTENGQFVEPTVLVIGILFTKGCCGLATCLGIFWVEMELLRFESWMG